MKLTSTIAVVTLLAATGLFAESSTLEVSGGTLAYEVAGQGPVVVLLHGSFLDRRTWDDQMAVLSARFRVVRYDIRPFGQSRSTETYSPAADLLSLLDHLGVAKAHLVGHSFGGTVALDFALAHPERVASLVLAAAAPSGFALPEEEKKRQVALFAAARQGEDEALAAWLAHPIWDGARTKPEVFARLEAISRDNAKNFLLKAPPFRLEQPQAAAHLADIAAPTLVLVGDRDTPANRAASDALAQGIAGARLLVVASAGHALNIEQPAAFNEAVERFLGGLP